MSTHRASFSASQNNTNKITPRLSDSKVRIKTFGDPQRPTETDDDLVMVSIDTLLAKSTQAGLLYLFMALEAMQHDPKAVKIREAVANIMHISPDALQHYLKNDGSPNGEQWNDLEEHYGCTWYTTWRELRREAKRQEKK